mgnify:FL=1|jgi:hypothetical protein|nr:MAG TPA: hypothetical protein [Caudoviricetes sp.]
MANKRQQMYQSQNQDRNHMSTRRQRQLEEEEALRQEEEEAARKEQEEKEKEEAARKDRLDSEPEVTDPNDPDYLEPALYDMPEGDEVIVPEYIVESQQDGERDLEDIDQNRTYNETYDRLSQDEVLSKVSVTAQMSILGIIEYVAKMKQFKGHILTLMADKNFVVNEGPAMQVEIFNNIMDIITKTDSVSFRYSMDFLLQLMCEEPEVLGLLNLSRFQENLALDPVSIRCYANLMNLLTSLKDPMTRQKELNTTIDIAKALEYGFSEGAKTRLMNYFYN